MRSRRFPVVKALAERLGYSRLAELEQEAVRRRPVPTRLIRKLSVVDEGAEIRLTPRQREVMVLLASGLSRREIADELGVSTETVKRHLRLAYGALGVHDRVQAINTFLERAA